MADEQHPQAEEMIAKWLEYNRLWMQHDFPNEDHSQTFPREYVLAYRTAVLEIPEDERQIVYVYMALDDELNNATLLGVYEENELVYITMEVDTNWASLWTNEYPVGLIDESNPWRRTGKFVELPA